MLYREINAVCSQIHTKHINNNIYLTAIEFSPGGSEFSPGGSEFSPGGSVWAERRIIYKDPFPAAQ